MSATDRRDVIDVLSGDHRAVEELFERLEAGDGSDGSGGADGSGGSRKSLVDALALELAWHTTAAQRYLLPLARRTLPDGDALADRHTAEHLTVEHMVRDLEAKDPSDARFEPLLAQLVAAARGHIEHEEQITFVELTRECDSAELLAAGLELIAARARAGLAAGSQATIGQAAAGEAATDQAEAAATAAAAEAVPAQPSPDRLEAGPASSVVDRVRAMLES